jgi:hypothetical protein
MQTLFATRPLDGDTWMMIGAVALAAFVIMEIEKAVLRRLLR